MLYVHTLFDPQRDGHPLATGLYDTVSKEVNYYTLWQRGTGKTLYDVELAINAIANRFNQAEAVVVNDLKQHLIGFPSFLPFKVYDFDLSDLNDSKEPPQKRIGMALKAMLKIQPQEWHRIRAEAAVVYAHLQRKGVSCGGVKHPVWGWAWSGRSKTTGPNIQGLSDDQYLANLNNDPIYLHFDWVSADFRAIALISKDEQLNQAFEQSDPYQYLVDHLNKNLPPSLQLTRSAGKSMLLPAMYSLSESGEALQLYSGLKNWIRAGKKQIREDGYLTSILGRKFVVKGEKTDKSVFNAIFQGTVAHAMQICLKKVYDIYPDSILVESHDSLVLTSKKDDLKSKIMNVARIMVQPFEGILTENPQFPITVSVGKGYKRWKEYKRFKTYGEIR